MTQYKEIESRHQNESLKREIRYVIFNNVDEPNLDMTHKLVIKHS